MGKFKELMNEKFIVESSISRIWQHINNPSTIFAVISAYLNEKDDKLNHEQLRKDIKQLQLGYIEMDSGYSYKSKDTQIVANEKSYMIPNISKRQAITLAQKYRQESILWKDEISFILLGTREDIGIGEELMKFKSNGKTLTFDKNEVKKAFSSLIKVSKNQRGRKFAYLKEMRIKDYPTVYLYAGKNIPDDEWLRIL